MVKSDLSKKQSKASGSAHPKESETTMRNPFPSFSASNYYGIFKDPLFYNEAVKMMINFLPTYPLFGAFDSFTEVVPQELLFQCAFSAFKPNHNYQEVHLNLIDDSLVVLTKEKFLFVINLRVPSSTKFYSPSIMDVFSALYQKGY